MRTAAAGLVVGYLSLDHVVRLRSPLALGATTLVSGRLTGESGRLGGCVTEIARGLVAEGQPVEVLSWIGPDAAGRRLAGELSAEAIGVRGIDDGLDRTSSTWLCYAPDGASYCIYDPGGELPGALSPSQRELAADAGFCVVSVGPPGPTLELLGLLGEESLVVWSVKADRTSFTEELAGRLRDVAAVVVWSRDEAAFLDDRLGTGWRTGLVRRGALPVETRGSEGACYFDATGEHLVPVQPVPVTDSTGAGDRFVAGLTAALRQGAAAGDAVAVASAGARSFLAARAGREPAAPASGHPAAGTAPEHPASASPSSPRRSTDRPTYARREDQARWTDQVRREDQARREDQESIS